MEPEEEITPQDALYTLKRAIQEISSFPKSRANSLALTKLDEALMWFEAGLRAPE